MNFTADTWWLLGIIFTGAIAIIGFFLKRTISQTDEHNKAIKKIELSYVTKDELKEFKSDVNNGIVKLQTDVDEIKAQTLTKADYYRQQTKTDNKIDKIYDLLIKQQQGGYKSDE